MYIFCLGIFGFLTIGILLWPMYFIKTGETFGLGPSFRFTSFGNKCYLYHFCLLQLYMNVEIRTDAAHFPFWKYFAVWQPKFVYMCVNFQILLFSKLPLAVCCLQYSVRVRYFGIFLAFFNEAYRQEKASIYPCRVSGNNRSICNCDIGYYLPA